MTGYLASRRPHPLLDVEREVLAQPRRRLLPGLRRHRPGRGGDLLGVRARARAPAPARRCAVDSRPDAPPHRHARGHRADGRSAVARHADAGLRLGLSRVSADAGAARRGQVRQPLPARHGRARRIRPRRPAPARCRPAEPASSSWRSSSSPTSSRCARRSLHAFRRHPGRSTRCSRKSRAGSCWSEVPFYPPQGVFENGSYVLNSTAHWRPLMNGYSGYMPERVSANTRRRSGTFRRSTRSRRCGGPARRTSWFIPSGFGTEAEVAKMWQDVAASPYLERIAVDAGGAGAVSAALELPADSFSRG